MGRKKKQNTGFDSGMEILYNSGVKKLMIYGLDEPLLSRAEAIADELGIMTSIIGDDVLEEKLGSLMEKQEDFPARHCEFDLPYLIADGMTVKDLVEYLTVLRKSGCEFEGIKIMRTETNQDWTIRRLFEHTREEHEAAKKAVILDEMIRSCNGIDLSSVEQPAQNLLKERLLKAYMLLKSGKFSNEEVTKAIEDLSESLKGVRKLYN